MAHDRNGCPMAVMTRRSRSCQHSGLDSKQTEKPEIIHMNAVLPGQRVRFMLHMISLKVCRPQFCGTTGSPAVTVSLALLSACGKFSMSPALCTYWGCLHRHCHGSARMRLHPCRHTIERRTVRRTPVNKALSKYRRNILLLCSGYRRLLLIARYPVIATSSRSNDCLVMSTHRPERRISVP